MARYKYVAGREGLLPSAIGVTHPTHQSPHVGSVIQSIIAVLVVGLFAIMGMDPVLQLFTWLTQLGALGVLGLMAVTSFSVIAFFGRMQATEGPLQTKILPAIAGVAMAALFVLIFAQFGALTGAAGWLGVALPALVLVFAAIGYLWHPGWPALTPRGLPVWGKTSKPLKGAALCRPFFHAKGPPWPPRPKPILTAYPPYRSPHKSC